ncbi:MAG: hypothetical protein ABFS86_04580 [Planctomycetota bacterium]
MTKTTMLLFVLLLAVPVAAQEEKKTEKPDPTARFWEARKVMLAGKPADAAELFRVLLKEHPGTDVADDCLYWAGRCWLRVDDREPDAVVAFKRLVETMPASPFVDDAARELKRLGDVTLAPALAKRLEGAGAEAELAARALAELGDARGVEWLAGKRGEKKEDAAPAAAPARKEASEPEKPESHKKSKDDEIEELRAEVKRLRKELDETVKLVEKLLAEKPGMEGKPDPESETKK